MRLSYEKILNITDGVSIKKSHNSLINSISLDSRIPGSKSLFLAFKGENKDGHDYLFDAYQNGYRSFIVANVHKLKNLPLDDVNIIKATNPLIAYGQIARYYKKTKKILSIGITGSCGKTTTKDFTTSVLSKTFKTLSSEKNYNNEIGLPRTILKLSEEEIIISELGLEKKGDISYLADILKPDIAVITNIGLSHIKNFTNQKGIFKAKMEIVENFNKNSLLIINGDDKYLKTIKKDAPYKILTFGFNKESDLKCTKYKLIDNKIIFTCSYNNNSYDFTIKSIAKHNILNAMASILVALYLNVPIKDIKKGLLNAQITEGRLTIIKRGSLTIINDCYNASLSSMKSAIDALNTFHQRKVAILGDIKETGKYSEQIHSKIGKHLKGKINVLILTGKEIKACLKEAKQDPNLKIYYFKDNAEILKNINKIITKDDVILVKGSHAMHLDLIERYLENETKL